MSVKDFDIRPKAHASPTSRPIIVSNKLRQDPMVKPQARPTASTPAVKTTKTIQPSIKPDNRQAVVSTAQEKQTKKSKRTYVKVFFGIALVIIVINFLLDAGIISFALPLLPFTNLF
jgi:hypothetical protein